jgi:cyclophilin family peptidyl-prolyl cis-trans isomerase
MPIVDASANGSGGVGVDAAGAEETTPLTDTRSFLAELAPLAAMPHSVFFFLELVRLGVWDDTVFFHHENVEHILTAIPMDFLTGDPKPRLDSIGAKTLSFPEYSADYPHEKYTLGFPNMGPNFYINTRSNVEMHGPGGQGHHILPLDADPCFGRVIEGKDAVDDLIRLGQWEGNSAQIREVNGVDPGAQFVTRIISIDIVRSSSQIAD